MVVISDSSPLIGLAAIQRLDILPRLFTTVVLPQAVFEEVAVQGKGKPGAEDVRRAEWITVMTCRDVQLVQQLGKDLDQGEAEAIVLAIETRADLLIIDDAQGRKKAQEMGVAIVGLMGVLLKAKQKKVIDKVKPIIDKLLESKEFWISKPVYKETLHQAGEP